MIIRESCVIIDPTTRTRCKRRDCNPRRISGTVRVFFRFHPFVFVIVPRRNNNINTLEIEDEDTTTELKKDR